MSVNIIVFQFHTISFCTFIIVCRRSIREGKILSCHKNRYGM